MTPDKHDALEAFLYCIIRDHGFGMVEKYWRELGSDSCAYTLWDDCGAAQARSYASAIKHRTDAEATESTGDSLFIQ